MKKSLIFLSTCLAGAAGVVVVPCIGISLSSQQSNYSSSDSDGNLVNNVLQDNLYDKYSNLSSDMTKVFSNDGTIADADHTWAFVGGVASGTMDDLGAARNYIGHFEEDIRGMWTYPSIARSQKLYNYLQRYVADLTQPGFTLEDINQNWNKVKDMNAESVTYLISDEDYFKNDSISSSNLDAFLNQLVIFILNGLQLREGNGYVFLQKHWATNSIVENSLIQKYNEQVDKAIELVNLMNPNFLKRITVVNHYINTINDLQFMKDCLNNNNQLNQYGQFEIGRQFAEETYAKVIGDNGKPIDINWGAEHVNLYSGVSDKVDLNKSLTNETFNLGTGANSTSVYINELQTTQPISDYLTYELPTVTSTPNSANSSLTVNLPASVKDNISFVYKLRLSSGYFVEGKVNTSNNSFIIPNLQLNKDYSLKIFTIDGKQLPTIWGNTSNSNVTTLPLTANSSQQKFQQKLKSNKKLNWVVIGDSITHAAAWTKGWNGVTQDFYKSLQQDYGRTDDTLINLSLSGNFTTEELANMKYRLYQTNPDVVIISLGLNDIKNGAGFGGVNKTVFVGNLAKIIQEARKINPNIDFLVNNTIPSSYVTNDKRAPYNTEMNNSISSLSTDNSLVILNDLNTDFITMLSNRGYYQSSKSEYFYSQERNHLTVQGSMFMALCWLDALGFDVNDSRLSYMSYVNLESLTNINKIPVLSLANNRLTVNLQYVATATDVFDIYVKVKDTVTGQIFDATTNTKIITDSNNKNVLFDVFESSSHKLEVTAVGYSLGGARKYIFTPQYYPNNKSN